MPRHSGRGRRHSANPDTDGPASDGRPCRQPHRITRSVRSASHVHDEQRVRSRQPILPGPWHQRPRLLHLSSARSGLDRHAGRCATALHRNERARSDLPEQRRLELRRRGHRYARQAAGCVQPVAHTRAHPNWHRRPGWRRVRHRRCRRSVPMRRAGDVGVDVPTTAALNQSPIPQRGHVGWPRIIGDNHRPSGPRATGGRRDNQTCAGGPTPDRSGETGDRVRSRRGCLPRRP